MLHAYPPRFNDVWEVETGGLRLRDNQSVFIPYHETHQGLVSPDDASKIWEALRFKPCAPATNGYLEYKYNDAPRKTTDTVCIPVYQPLNLVNINKIEEQYNYWLDKPDIDGFEIAP